MGRAALLLPIMLACSASNSAQISPIRLGGSGATAAISATAAATVSADAAPASDDLNYSISEWRQFRQGGNFSFAQYAHFLNYNDDWPGESKMRSDAEKAMRPGENAGLVLAFYRKDKPQSGNGWSRYAEALSSAGQAAEALAAARSAWASDDLSAADEAMILARFGTSLTTADHDARVDSLLFNKDPDDAARLLAWTSPDRRAAFAARVAMLQKSSDAESLFQTVQSKVGSDAGLMMDRLRYLKDSGNEQSARQLAGQPHQFTDRPADPGRWYEMMLILANGAADDRQWTLTYNIARQLDDAFPAGTQISDQSYEVRDNYTSLAWLAGRAALDRTNNPANATAMFYRYAYGGKSLQVATKGFYWAGRASLAAGRASEASAYFRRAALYPELFYGQLALERLGQPVPAPAGAPAVAATDPTRTAFLQSRLVRAVRQMAYYGRADEQMQFVRALAESLKTPTERSLAMELGRQLGRRDVGVWVARAARNDGDAFYVRDAFPVLSSQPRSAWVLANGITRQESSFDQNAISWAGARGMMQLMPGTAQDQARKLGVGYDSGKLHDPDYNVMLGSSYFQHLLDVWNGSVPLAVASYNAGSGNVSKWIRAYGDPRTGQVDMVSWIEAIPFSETRGYVQRVIENTVVYDSMYPQPDNRTALHVSRYLGKGTPG